VTTIDASLLSTAGAVTSVPTQDNPDVPVLTAADDSIVVNTKAGNPGYLQGSQVLAGASTTVVVDAITGATGSAVPKSAAGLHVLARDASRLCMPLASTADRESWTETVQFGVSSVYACELSLTQAQLQTLCPSTDVEQYLAFPATYVGMWGNSSVHNIEDWIKISKTTFPTDVTGTYVAATRTCTGLVTGMNLDIFVADYGAENNAQSAIIGARTEFTRDDWTFTGVSTTQTFPLSVNVTFYKYPTAGVVESSPRGPPVLPSLPSDFLYPFTLDNAAEERSIGWVIIAAVVALAAYM
jgi:hypothetical protein